MDESTQNILVHADIFLNTEETLSMYKNKQGKQAIANLTFLACDHSHKFTIRKSLLAQHAHEGRCDISINSCHNFSL